MTRFERVELGAGAGLVAVFGEVALFVADGDAAGPLVDVVRDAAAAGSPPGTTVARRLVALLAGDDSGALADFGVIAATDRGWMVLLRGDIAAAVVPAGEGEARHLSGTDSITWLDRLLPGDTAAVLIGSEGAAQPGPSPTSLEAGVVPGGWLRAVLPPPGERPVTAGTSTITGRAATIPPPPRDSSTTAIPVPGSTTESVAPALPTGEVELFSLSPSGLAHRDPLPIVGVGAVSGHTDVPGAVAPPTAEVRDEVTAHSFGLLVFDDNSTFGLDADYLVGREPESDAVVIDGRARPIVLDDPEGTVSRVHAEIRLVAGGVQLVDRGSTNGTHLWDPSAGEWDRLVPGEPRAIQPGDRGAIGQRTFVYERPAVPAGGGPALRALETAPVGSVAGVLAGQDDVVHPLDRNYVIGRDPMADAAVRRAQASPLVLRDDPTVSDVHARVTVDAGAVYLADVAGSSGTFVAAPGAGSWDPIGTSPVELEPGWSMRVGRHVLTYRAATA